MLKQGLITDDIHLFLPANLNSQIHKHSLDNEHKVMLLLLHPFEDLLFQVLSAEEI